MDLRKATRLLPFFLAASGCSWFEKEPDITKNAENDALFKMAENAGWIGNENSAQIEDDILLFGGGSLPDKVDLSPFLPPIMSQDTYGICVACATGYYQKTLLNARDRNWSYIELSYPSNQTSPKDLFLSIDFDKRGLGSNECWGTWFEVAYSQLQSRGAADNGLVPFFPGNMYKCTEPVHADWTQKAASNKIQSYRELPIEVDAIQQKLAAGLPVGITTILRDDFIVHKFGVLKTNNGQKDYHHAMLVVGYDNNKEGGAFKIVNSWGTTFGDQGFIWVSYELFVQNLCQNAFVAYNSINPDDPNDPIDPTITGGNLASWVYADQKNPAYPSEPRQRTLTFDIFNLGSQFVPSTPAWDAVYLYFNAYNMNDFGVIHHFKVTTEFGPGQGQLPQGLGSSGNYWINSSLSPGERLSSAMFGPSSGSINWDYLMPPVTGYYYLVLISDVYNQLGEGNEQDNLYYVTNQFGGPIWFQNGIWQGFKGAADERASENPSHQTLVNANNLNAYTPEELRFFIRNMRASGKLKERVLDSNKAGNTMPTAGN